MIVHEFICDGCRVMVEDSNTKGVHVCPKCGEEMRWDLRGIGIAQGDYNHVSDSLAIDPSQIPEHRANFPDVDVLPDGRPHFTSVKQQSKYLEKCGFHKHPQKVKSKKRSL